MYIKRNIKLGSSLVLLTALSSCVSGPKVQEFPATANSAEEIQKLTADIRAASEHQVDVLSPTAYREANSSLKEADHEQKKGADAKDILHAVAEGRSHIERANRFAEVSRSNLEAVVAAREAAVKAGADKSFAEDFKNADDHLRDVTTKVEENDLTVAVEKRGQLQKEYLDVELKAIKLASIGSARATIATAVKEGAPEYAKQSLAIAEKKADEADAFIVANRYQTDEIKARSGEAIEAADQLLNITRSAKAGKNMTPEQIALQLDSEKNKTKAQHAKLTNEKEAAKGLASETKSLKAEQAFNQKFEEARAQFTSEEAEVYRQGNRLVIRLRTLEFPVNQAVLRGSNFPVLGKVANVVKGFENTTVVIEGHTDSDGSKALNRKLSTERAQAVSTYLVSAKAIDPSKITVDGYGSQRPLASNKTVKGKAENRRVDVILTPHLVTE